jgi:hypothetical protein
MVLIRGGPLAEARWEFRTLPLAKRKVLTAAFKQERASNPSLSWRVWLRRKLEETKEQDQWQ